MVPLETLFALVNLHTKNQHTLLLTCSAKGRRRHSRGGLGEISNEAQAVAGLAHTQARVQGWVLLLHSEGS